MPYQHHLHVVTPSDDTVLWRYMELARFLQLIDGRHLWFSRADKFNDPLEGTLTDGEFNYEPETPDEPPRFREATADPLAQMMRHTTYVNCWRMGENESMAMWDLYGKGTGVVAVTTTVGRLKRQLENDDRPVYIAEVQYVDWQAPRELRGTFDLITRKDISYQHEGEARLFVWNTAGIQAEGIYIPDEIPPGLTFGIDPQATVTQIWISPRDHPSIKPLIANLIARYGLQIPIKMSNRLTTRRQVHPRS
jgi:hypothetical protein